MSSRPLALIALLAGAAWAGSAAADITLAGEVRDFAADGANFEGAITGLQTGLVQSTLTGLSPTLTAAGAAQIATVGAGAFGNWFTKSTELVPYSLTLSETAPGSGIYSFGSSSFFPIDGTVLGNEGRSHNYHFTFAIHAQFGYTPGAGQTFSFTGDDDVWVFFDRMLGIDLGGVHPAAGASVNLDTLFGFGTASAKAAGNYAFDFFFAERHTSDSNLNIQTSLLLTAPPPVNPPVTPIPEPETYALMLAGLAALGTVARRRRSA